MKIMRVKRELVLKCNGEIKYTDFIKIAFENGYPIVKYKDTYYLLSKGESGIGSVKINRVELI